MTFLGRVSAALPAILLLAARGGAQPASLSPGTMARTGAVDVRFQSYNIEMVEVTGGRFWKPYGQAQSAATHTPRPGGAPAGIDPNLFEYRPPIDLSNPRLRKLASALGPAYVRVSGTWANTIYFHDSDSAAPASPPAGFNAILTRKQWKGVVDFTRAVNGKLVTSFATGVGTRDAAGAWNAEQARRFVRYTKSVGGSIVAAEFMNEPNFAVIGGAPQGYDAAAYGRDVKTFRGFFREALPGAVWLGPGSVAEGGTITSMPIPGRLTSADLLKATGPVYDAFSYHQYSAVSQRCAAGDPAMGTTAAAALSKEWLLRTDSIFNFYRNLRDQFEPGKPIWLTETADTACGGNAWGSTFLDTFRYLDQHGRLARQGVQVIAHNTLAASDYGLLDEKTLAPRPNYWAAVLWRRLMGTVVLNPGPAARDNFYLYAQCMPDHPGGVTVLAINAGTTAQDLELPVGGERYTLTANELESTAIELNGHVLQTAPDGTLPKLAASPSGAGNLRLPPVSSTFIGFPKSGNAACR